MLLHFIELKEKGFGEPINLKTKPKVRASKEEKETSKKGKEKWVLINDELKTYAL